MAHPCFNNRDPICGQVIQVNCKSKNSLSIVVCMIYSWFSDGGMSVVAEVVDKCLSCKLPYDVDMSNVTFSVLADPVKGRLADPGITWSFVPTNTPLGETKFPAPPPPPGTPPPPAKRSLDGNEQWKQTPEPNGFAPPQGRRMVKTRTIVGQSDTQGANESNEARNPDHLTKPNGDPEPHPVRRDVPSRSVTNRAVEQQTRKPPSRRMMPPQTPSFERRMIKVARRSS
jgi:hypothetical protein